MATPESNAVATYDPTGGTRGIVLGHHVADFQEFAKVLAVSELLPDGLRGKPGNVFMALMQGLDLGLRPMQALNLIDVIKGKPCMNAQGMRALITAAGHEINVVEWTEEKCVIEGRRAGTSDWRQASFTIQQAQAAGLTGDNWKKYPADMLLARATSRLAKAYFADVTNGLATVEEVLDIAATPTKSLAEIAAARDTVAEPTVEEVDDDAIRAAVLAAAGDSTETEPVDAELDEPDPSTNCPSCGLPAPDHDTDCTLG